MLQRDVAINKLKHELEIRDYDLGIKEKEFATKQLHFAVDKAALSEQETSWKRNEDNALRMDANNRAQEVVIARQEECMKGLRDVVEDLRSCVRVLSASQPQYAAWDDVFATSPAAYRTPGTRSLQRQLSAAHPHPLARRAPTMAPTIPPSMAPTTPQSLTPASLFAAIGGTSLAGTTPTIATLPTVPLSIPTQAPVAPRLEREKTLQDLELELRIMRKREADSQ